MATWGEMGNWVSAKVLSKTIQTMNPNYNIQQVAAENIFPTFAEIGKKIKTVTLRAKNPEERLSLYSGLLDNEAKKLDVVKDVELKLVDELIDEIKPNIIIGTKGVICRVVAESVSRKSLNIPVVNYVTNHGLFKLRIHNCERASAHIVRLMESKEFLMKEAGLPAHKIFPVGYLLNTAVKTANFTNQNEIGYSDLDKVSVIILSNRGNEEYIDVFNHIIESHPDLKVCFIAVNNESQFQKGIELVNKGNAKNAIVRQELDQSEFMRLLIKWRISGPTIFISKTSPNAVFEAVYLNLPLLMLKSGLPMEDWAASFIEKYDLGKVTETADGIILELDKLLKEPRRLKQIQKNQINFSQKFLHQSDIPQKINSVLLSLS